MPGAITRPRCGQCGTGLEKRAVRDGATTVNRLYCSTCGGSFPLNEVCAVCGTASSHKGQAVTVHRSLIIGTHTVRHCTTCRPPSKAAVEFQTAFFTSLMKYGCSAGCATIIVIAIVAALLSAGRH